MTTTYATLISDTERRLKDAERTAAAAALTIKTIRERAEQGRRDLSADELMDIGHASGVKAQAGSEIAELARQLRELREQDEGDQELARRMQERHPAAAGSHGRESVERPGGGRAEDRAGEGPRWVRTNDYRPAVVARGSRFAEHEVVEAQSQARATADAAVIGQHGSLGHLVRAMTTTSGSAVVPTVWLGDIIDRARNMAAVLRAGAEIVPMDAKTVQIGRLTGDPTAAFRTEGSTITASDPVFDNVTLDSKTMSTLVVGSLEWFQDADNVDAVVSEAIAQAFALELDRQALYGGITTGGEVGATGFNTTFPTPPNPRGVLAALLGVASSSVLGSGANGTAQTALTYWNEVIDTIFTVRGFNEAPNGLIWSSKLAQQYAKAYDSTGQPLAIPPSVAEISRYISNQIPSFTQGTMTTRATDLFAGDWTQLLIGQRLDLTIQTLTERYAENGQIGIVAHWRGDVQPARPRAFAVYRYLQGA